MVFSIYPNNVDSRPLIGEIGILDVLDKFFIKKEDYYMDMNISNNEIWLYQKRDIKKKGGKLKPLVCHE